MDWKLGDRAVVPVTTVQTKCASCAHDLGKRVEIWAEGEVNGLWQFHEAGRTLLTRVRVVFRPEFEYEGGSIGCVTVDAPRARKPETEK